jgi:hypothetical protein
MSKHSQQVTCRSLNESTAIVQSLKNASLKAWEEFLTQKSILHIYRHPPDRQSAFYKSDAFCDIIWYINVDIVIINYTVKYNNVFSWKIA